MAGKNRSPNYPAIGLTEAVASAAALYDKSGRAALPQEAVVVDLGYRGMNGPARTKLSALRKYGLLENAPGGKLRLSNRAITLTQPGVDAHEYYEALVAAANSPAIFAELRQQHLPSNEALKLILVREKGFSDAGATQFIQAFRDTNQFVEAHAEGYNDPVANAGTADVGTRFSVRAGDEGRGMESAAATVRAQGATSRTIQVPISPTTWALIQLPAPMSEDDWNQMLGVLQAMKPGLVAKPSAGDDDASSSRS